MKKYLKWEAFEDRAKIIESLEKNSICVGSSDTVYGFLSNTSEEAVCSMDLIKKRSGVPYIILVESIEKAKFFSEKICDEKVLELVSKYWPGPLTIVLPASKNVPCYLKSSNNTVALRIPDHCGLKTILAYFNGLLSTSANITGSPIVKNICDLDEEILTKIAYCIVDKKIALKDKMASTVLDCTFRPWRCLRQGGLIEKIVRGYQDIC